jgi:hypothetical protein
LSPEQVRAWLFTRGYEEYEPLLQKISTEQLLALSSEQLQHMGIPAVDAVPHSAPLTPHRFATWVATHQPPVLLQEDLHHDLAALRRLFVSPQDGWWIAF